MTQTNTVSTKPPPSAATASMRAMVSLLSLSRVIFWITSPMASFAPAMPHSTSATHPATPSVRGGQTRGGQTRRGQTRGSQTRGSQTRGSQTRGRQTRADAFDWRMLCVAIGLACGTSSSGCAPPAETELADVRQAMLREIGLPVASNAESPKSPSEPNSVETEAAPTLGVPASAVEEVDVRDPKQATQRIEPNRSRVQTDDRTRAWIDAGQLPRLTWEIQYAGNTPVGYIRRSVEPSKSQGNGTLRIEAESRTFLQRTGKTIDRRTQIVSIERANGELLRVEGTLQTDTKKSRFIGIPKDNTLKVETSSEGRTTTQTFPWEPGLRGPFAIEQSLMREPLREQEIREVKYFDPVQLKTIDARLEAMDYVETAIFDGTTERLLEVQSTALVDGNETRALIWLDERGESHKSYLPGIDVRSFRCDAITARYVISKSEMDALSIRDVVLFGNVTQIDATPSVTYRLELRSNDSLPTLSSRTNQVARLVKPKVFDVTVHRVTPPFPPIEGLDADDRLVDAYSTPSPLLTSNHPQIARFVRQSFETEGLDLSSPLEARSEALRTAIAERLELIPFDKKVIAGNEILKLDQGDSIDHAILLATTLRAAQAPARIAFGLRFNQSKVRPLMVLHAWVEYHEGKHWIPIDSSIAERQVPNDRIKFSESALESLNPFEPILSIARLIPNLEIIVTR
jgi:hypothetical protein